MRERRRGGGGGEGHEGEEGGAKLSTVIKRSMCFSRRLPS